MSIKPLEIIILAAGKGSRMKSSVPKVLHKIAGTSLLGHVLNAANQLSPQKIHVVVGHGKELVINEFGDIPINWVEQNEQLGTGHAVLQVLPLVSEDSNVLMLTADVPLIRSDTLNLLNDAMSAFPLALLTAQIADPSGLGRIIRDASDGVCGIIEHKDASASQRNINEINSGIMCARGNDLKRWLDKVGNDNTQKEYYLTDIVEIAYAEGNPITACQPTNAGEVDGINTRSQLAIVERHYQYKRAEELMAEGVTLMDPARIDIRGEVEIGPDTTIDINTVIVGPSKIGSNVNIGPNCMISASTIGNGTTIHANSVIESSSIHEQVNIGPFARLRPGTELLNKVKIGNFVETKNARLEAGAKVNHLSYVGDATVGQDTNIGAGVITCNYDGADKHKTDIGRDVFVGSNSQLVAPVVIGDGATIGAGSTITSDVEAQALAISRARQRKIQGWQRPEKGK